jgi:ribosomal-protein-alanine N-acetyltransferase
MVLLIVVELEDWKSSSHTIRAKNMKIPESFIIETDRLLLRIPLLEDIPFVFSATRYPGFNDGMLWEPPNNPDELLIPHQDIFSDWKNGSAYNFPIINKIDNSLIGRISIRKEKELDTWNIGFWTHPEKQNKGFMKEALSAVLKFSFTMLDATKITACHALWNIKSERVLKKSEMVFSRYIEKGYQKNGKWNEENLLEIKKSDWKE